MEDKNSEEKLLKEHENILKNKKFLIFVEVWQDKQFNWSTMWEEKVIDMGGKLGMVISYSYTFVKLKRLPTVGIYREFWRCYDWL